eukprot:TRINITY_DN29760_c0_g1_i1.p1 TRINITY_DN29760_c0_g1~~TRINITY_DN29760_c0_g1_i1.p1  ORF type:complete len:685 (+),score=103.53 TRINITY_DN29760_c0_g1_i1:133-2055(+)
MSGISGCGGLDLASLSPAPWKPLALSRSPLRPRPPRLEAMSTGHSGASTYSSASIGGDHTVDAWRQSTPSSTRPPTFPLMKREQARVDPASCSSTAGSSSEGGWRVASPSPATISRHGVGESLQSVACRVRDAEIAYELREAAYAQMKVRLFAAIAPVLRARLRDEEERILCAAVGSWRYYAASVRKSMARDVLVSSSRVACRRNATASGLRLSTKVYMFACSQFLAVVIRSWHGRAAVTAGARRAVTRIACVRSRRPDAVMAVFDAWRAAIAGCHVTNFAEVACARRRELRLQLCEARHEAAHMNCEAERAETNGRELWTCADRALEVLSLAGLCDFQKVSPAPPRDADHNVRVFGGCAEKVSRDGEATPLNEDSVLQQCVALVKLRHDMVAKLADARQRLASACASTSVDLASSTTFSGGGVASGGRMAVDARFSSGVSDVTAAGTAAAAAHLGSVPPSSSMDVEVSQLHESAAVVRQLRATCAELAQDVASSRNRALEISFSDETPATPANELAAASPMPRGHNRFEQWGFDGEGGGGESRVDAVAALAAGPRVQLERERARTRELERRVAEAQEWVASLRARHKHLVEERAELESGHAASSRWSGTCDVADLASPQDVQRALCELARVSEELLTAA